MAVHARHILQLYKTLLRESAKFESYNYRMYALRRIKDAFRERKGLCDPQAIEEAINEGKSNLDVIRRQALISIMYKTDKLVIEKNSTVS